MELTAEEMKIIQDRRNAEAKKAEEAAKAARSKEEKALEAFQVRANAQNADALDLCVDINSQAPGRFTCVKNNMTNAHCLVDGKRVEAEEVGFKNFGAQSVTVSDAFGNSITVSIDSRKLHESTRYNPVNKFHIGHSFIEGHREYNGDKSKNAARIVIKRLEEMREKQIIEEKKKNKCEIARKFIQSKMPIALNVSIHIGEYATVKYEANQFPGAYDWTCVKGEVQFNDDMTVKSWTKSINGIYSSNNTDKDVKLIAMKKEYDEAVKALTAKFNDEAIEVLNG